MLTLAKLKQLLSDNNCDFEIIAHETPIIKTQDAAKYFDIDKAAPTFIMDTEQGIVAFVSSSRRGRIDFNALKEQTGFTKFKMADRNRIKEQTGYQAGEVPLIGHGLPCVFDTLLLDEDYIYGGSGDALHTLKIAPGDLMRISNVIVKL